MKTFWTITILVAFSCMAGVAEDKPAKASDRFKIFTTQIKTPEQIIGIQNLGTAQPIKVISARIVVNDKGDTKGVAPTPQFLLCHFFDDKKQKIGTTTGIFFTLNSQNRPEASLPSFRSKIPAEVQFPYDSRKPWRTAIIVVGDERGAITHDHPAKLKNYGEFDFPEKIYLSK